MIPEDVKKWLDIANKLTSTSALIVVVFWLIYQSTGDRNNALYASKASAEEAAAVSRANSRLLDNHTRASSEDAAVMKMLLVQICINTANGDRQIINQCANYYR